MSPSAYKLIRYTYDNRGRMIQLTDALGQSESYTYDERGNCISESDGTSTKIYREQNPASNNAEQYREHRKDRINQTHQ